MMFFQMSCCYSSLSHSQPKLKHSQKYITLKTQLNGKKTLFSSKHLEELYNDLVHFMRYIRKARIILVNLLLGRNIYLFMLNSHQC